MRLESRCAWCGRRSGGSFYCTPHRVRRNASDRKRRRLERERLKRLGIYRLPGRGRHAS